MTFTLVVDGANAVSCRRRKRTDGVVEQRTTHTISNGGAPLFANDRPDQETSTSCQRARDWPALMVSTARRRARALTLQQ